MIIDAPKPSHRQALRDLWQEAFGDTDAFLDTFENTAFSTARCRCLSDGNDVKAALYWFDCRFRNEHIAYLYAIATAKAHRGQGLCRTLIKDTHAHLASLGYAGSILVPSEPSLFGFYEKLGYRTLGYIGELSCRASDETIELRKINAEEYASLRRKLLPDNGIHQENENLAFLETMYDLYAGNGLLLAARREGDKLHASELLGAPEKAPSVVASLGCAEGVFRIPQGDTPFAMYRPLKQHILPSPIYFGLAFD